MSVRKSIMEHATVRENESSVSVDIKDPEVSKKDVEEMVDTCRSGNNSCCGDEFFSSIDGISVSEANGVKSIDIRGKGLTGELMKDKVKTCNCGCAGRDE